ncbi:hypothetical protein JZ751_016072, partial [Albula glossodonta]
MNRIHYCVDPAGSMACMGNSGGPLLCQKHGVYYLFGLMTWPGSQSLSPNILHQARRQLVNESLCKRRGTRVAPCCAKNMSKEKMAQKTAQIEALQEQQIKMMEEEFEKRIALMSWGSGYQGPGFGEGGSCLAFFRPFSGLVSSVTRVMGLWVQALVEVAVAAKETGPHGHPAVWDVTIGLMLLCVENGGETAHAMVGQAVQLLHQVACTAVSPNILHQARLQLGNSGGPLLCQKHGAYYLFGLMTWPGSQCNASSPAVFTRVSPFQSWIKN